MKSKYLAVALSAVALTACNNDEVLEMNQGRGIQFQVATEASTRAETTTTNSIEDFKVWGFTDGKTLMNGIEVSKSGNEWTYGDLVFWPASPVTFYSVSPAENCGGTVSITNTVQQITNFTVNSDQTKQVDLLYAVNKDEEKDNHETEPVTINFRHALSQIVFKAKNTNPNLKVEIKGVKVAQVYKGGDFTYPTETTSAFEDDGAPTEDSQGTWKVNDEGQNVKADFAAGIKTQILTDKKDDAVDLTTKDGSSYTGALFMVPQTLSPWNHESEPSNTSNGSYFLVNCKIWNLCKNSQGKTDEVLLWPESENGYAEVAIPTGSTEWEQGKRYVYTFIFGEGGGFVPPTDDNNPGVPVLVPIDFTVSVDGFIDATPEEVEMDGEDNN